jgi:hypothetical protein
VAGDDLMVLDSRLRDRLNVCGVLMDVRKSADAKEHFVTVQQKIRETTPQIKTVRAEGKPALERGCQTGCSQIEG